MSPPESPSDRSAASAVSAAQRAALDAWPGAGFVIDPTAAALLVANARGRDLFPSIDPERGLALDGAMPAVRRLRELLRADIAPGAAVPLVFWTTHGIRALPCAIERQAIGDGRVLFLVKELGREPDPAQRAEAVAVPKPPPLPRSDEDTLREIARRIRQAQHESAPSQSGPSDQRVAGASGPGAGAVADVAGGIDLAKLAHELKTPLSAIVAAAEIMKEGRFGEIGNARYAGYVTDIHASARHALELIERMLDRRPKEHRSVVPATHFERIDLDRLVAECLSSVTPLAEAKGVKLRARRAQTAAVVTADGTALKQIVLNLLTNALKFTPAKGKITVSTVGSRQGAAALTVEDTGPGMTAVAIADALRPVPTDVPATRLGGGLGLGLPLSRALAEAMGAALSIDSAPGKGTRVTLAFPGGPLLAI